MSNHSHEPTPSVGQNEETRFTMSDKVTAGALMLLTAGTMLVARACSAPEDPTYPVSETTVTNMIDVSGVDILGNNADSRDN